MINYNKFFALVEEKEWQDDAKKINALLEKHKIKQVIKALDFPELKELLIKRPKIAKQLANFESWGWCKDYLFVSGLTNNCDVCKVEHDGEELRWNLFSKSIENILNQLKGAE